MKFVPNLIDLLREVYISMTKNREFVILVLMEESIQHPQNLIKTIEFNTSLKIHQQ